MDDILVPGNHGTELRVTKLSRKHNNQIVKCEVNNDVGKSEETETLDVNCKELGRNFRLFGAWRIWLAIERKCVKGESRFRNLKVIYKKEYMQVLWVLVDRILSEETVDINSKKKC